MINKPKTLFVLIIIFLAVLISLPLPFSKVVKIKFTEFLFPVIKGASHIVEKLFSVKVIFTAIKENRELRIENSRITNEINRLSEIQEENKRLRHLLDLEKTIPYESIPCRVIARDAGTWYRTLLIDKGKNYYIDVDMPVYSSGGVIGRIIDAGGDIAKVLLVTDLNSSIGGIIRDTRTVGLVEGNGSACVFSLVPKNADIKEGDVVVTSGLGDIFPKGLLIGEITGVSTGNQELYKVCSMKISADIDRVEEVLVLKIQKEKQTADLTPR